MSKARSIQRHLDSTATPLFIIDAQRRIRGFNLGCQVLTGWTAEEVLGQICNYGSAGDESGLAALAASLCPPPEAFSGEAATAPAYLVCRNGRAEPRMLQFFPLRSESGDLTGVLGLALPISSALPAARISPARQLHAELAALRASLRNRFGPDSLVCRSSVMNKVLAQVELARQSQASVLLVGEPGTGREHLARTIHFGSPGRTNWFVPLDCRRLGPDDLQSVMTRLLDGSQSEPASTPGPQPGTLFLADVDYLPRDLQEQLAAVWSGMPPGSTRLRLLASTSRSVETAVKSESMRSDFAAMLSTLTIEIPPLRSRGDDLPVLAQSLLELINRQGEKQSGGFDDAVWPLLLKYEWPGNIDELAQVVGEAHAHSVDSLVKPQDLPFRFRTALDAQDLPPVAEPLPLPLDALLEQVETRLIQQALERSRNNKSKAAELLGINRPRLYRRMEQLGIEDREE